MSPKFTGIWIPAEILSMPLTLSAKIVYGLLAGLDNEDGCFASNGYIASCIDCSDRQVRNIIAELEEAKLIIRGSSNGVRIIRTIEKDALCKVVGAEENFHPRRKRTSAKGGNTLPTYSIDERIDDNKGMVQLPFNSEAFKDIWNKYTTHRRQLKRPISKSQVTALFHEFCQWGEKQSIDSITTSILRGWVGVFPSIQNGRTITKTLTKDDHTNF
jgi:hypothetical protein